MLSSVEPTLDDRFLELRNQVDREILVARRAAITEIALAVSRMRTAANRDEWQAAVLDAGRHFSNDPEALELLGSLAALTAPDRPSVGGPAAAEKIERADPVINPAIDPAIDTAAQRFARVKVAEIQLYRSDAVRAGRASKDLYGALKFNIDEAREAFRERFLSHANGAGNGTADYLHTEMLHALANDDASLMGPGYPGPLA